MAKEVTGEGVEKVVREGAELLVKNADEIAQAGAKGAGKIGLKTTKELVKESTCNSDELYKYLLKNADENVAHAFLKEGKWPDGIQVPKSSSVLKSNGSIDWSKAAEGGYHLDANGNAIREQFVPKAEEVIDRYGSPAGRYTSPIVNGKPYSYSERSLPYVEDVSNYHKYEVVGDFSNIKKYVDNSSDIKLREKIDDAVTMYYDGDYSNLVSYKGEIAEVKGWGSGGGVQYEFPLTIEQLEKLELLKQIK